MASRHKVNKSDGFVVRELSGKGMSVIAIREIKPGELLIAEEPLFVIPWWIRHSMYPRKELKNGILRALDELPDEEVDMFYNLSDCKAEEGEEPTELGIWRTNNFALGRSNNKSKNGIFPNLSRFNHSCVPSAEFRWNEKLYRQEIRSIRNISPGEEITLCYFTLEVMAQSKEERQEYLESHYGFKCDCHACSLKGEESVFDDNQRMEVRNIGQEVMRLVYEWVDVDDSEENSENNSSSKDDNCEKQGNSNTSSIPVDIRSSDNLNDINIKLGKKVDSNSNMIDNPPIEVNVDNNSSDTTNSNQKNCISKNLADEEIAINALESECSSTDIDDDYRSAISLTKRRLQIMENLGFKMITRIDVCSNIVEYANEIGDVETARTYLEMGSRFATILYGLGSTELYKWKEELLKLNRNYPKL